MSALSIELGEVAAVDPRPAGSHARPEDKMIYSSQQNKWVNLQDSFRGQNARPEPPVEVPPDSVPAFQAHLWPDNHLGVDIRPHVWDKESSQFLLVDSGSQCTAFPPDPGDREVKGVFLKAVNGNMRVLDNLINDYTTRTRDQIKN